MFSEVVMSTWDWIQRIVLLIVTGCYAVSDVRTGKVRNQWILAGVAAGLLLTIPKLTIFAFGSALAGGAASLFIGYVLWKLHAFKAGDAKMFWVVGVFAGIQKCLLHIVVIILTGGVLALILMLVWGIFGKRMKRLGSYFYGMALRHRPEVYEPEENDNHRFAFGIAVFAGEVVLLLLQFIGVLSF